jgi:hypothetical protein
MLNSLIGIIASSGGVTSTNSYESIATTNVGSGGTSTITFSSIPATYQHLQLRYINATSTVYQNLVFRLNSDSGSNYAWHRILGTGSTVTADSVSPSTTSMDIGRSGNTSTAFAAGVFDLLDYANTNKYKTCRSLYGTDGNGAGAVFFASGLWMNTAAVTTITITSAAGNFVQYSSFALYGIKG